MIAPRSPMKRVVVACLVLAALAASGWWLRERASRRANSEAEIPTAPVARESLIATLPVRGSLESADETAIRFDPDRIFQSSRKIAEICENNAPLKAGDLVFQLDTKDLIDQRDQLAQDLADAQETVHKAEADGQVQISQAEGSVSEAQEALALARAQAQADKERAAAEIRFKEGELARAQRELDRDTRLAELHYIAGTALEQTKKSFRSQEFDLNQRRLAQQDSEKQNAEAIHDAETALQLAQHDLDAAKESVRLTVESGRTKVRDTQKKLDEANAQIAGCRVLAPKAGIAVIEMNRSSREDRRPFRAGDDVYPGSSPVHLFDVNKMQVRCQIGEMDISRVRKGEKAFVLSPSQSGRRYRAEVAAVDEVVRDSEVYRGGTPGKKIFGTVVRLLEVDPTYLRPGMTVDVEIVLADVEKTLTVPIRAVVRNRGATVVYRARGRDFEAVPVKTGTRSDLAIAVTGRLSPGDRVALARPPAKRVLAPARPARGPQPNGLRPGRT